MACRGVIFNMGGVLCDCEPLIAVAAAALFDERYHTVIDPADCRPFIGLGDAGYLRGLAYRYGVTLGDLDDDRRRFNELYLQIMKNRLRPVDGAAHLLNALGARGIRTAVATETDREKMIPNLRAIGLPAERFHVVVTGEDLSPPPEPDPLAQSPASPDPGAAPTPGADRLYRLAAERLGLTPADCLVFEDALVGVRAAKSAGFNCLAVTTSFTDPELREAGADATAPDLNHLPELATCW